MSECVFGFAESGQVLGVLRDGDVLVLRTLRSLSPEAMDRIRVQLHEVLGPLGIQALVIDGTQLEVAAGEAT